MFSGIPSEEHEFELLHPEGQSQGERWNKQAEKRYLKSINNTANDCQIK
jgi:hypothetical protein